MQFAEQQRVWKIVDQQNVDFVSGFWAKNYRRDNGAKGLRRIRWRGYAVQHHTTHCFSVDESGERNGG